MTASPSRRAPVRTAGQPDLPRVALRYGLVVTAGLVLLLVLVAGCGAAPLPAAAPSTIAPTTPAVPTPAPTTTAPPSPSSTSASPESGTRTGGRAAPGPHPTTPRANGGRAATPLWPARDAASAARLQRDVDGGRQPWLLDPVEVAGTYAGSELGYRNPGVFPIAAGRVDVQDGATPRKATLTLAQTVRRGDSGIWLVTGVNRR